MEKKNISRRNFIATTLAAATATATASTASATAILPSPLLQASKGKFKLKFAPHFGMFKNHAGEDLIDQLKFMADEGFTAFEDNGMKNRSVETQQKIAKELAKSE
ncbi:MAG: xylose isomerase, partial [Calditrichaeota bacterium]